MQQALEISERALSLVLKQLDDCHEIGWRNGGSICLTTDWAGRLDGEIVKAHLGSGIYFSDVYTQPHGVIWSPHPRLAEIVADAEAALPCPAPPSPPTAEKLRNEMLARAEMWERKAAAGWPNAPRNAAYCRRQAKLLRQDQKCSAGAPWAPPQEAPRAE